MPQPTPTSRKGRPRSLAPVRAPGSTWFSVFTCFSPGGWGVGCGLQSLSDKNLHLAHRYYR